MFLHTGVETCGNPVNLRGTEGLDEFRIDIEAQPRFGRKPDHAIRDVHAANDRIRLKKIECVQVDVEHAAAGSDDVSGCGQA